MTPPPTRVASWVLAAVLVASVLAVVAIAISPANPSDPYTEFYLLGANGTATEYPRDLTVGESAPLTVGATNHEHATVSYTVVLTLGDRTVETRDVTLDPGETWRGEFDVTARRPGTSELRVDLYRSADAEPYRRLRLNVTASRDRLARPTTLTGAGTAPTAAAPGRSPGTSTVDARSGASRPPVGRALYDPTQVHHQPPDTGTPIASEGGTRP